MNVYRAHIRGPDGVLIAWAATRGAAQKAGMDLVEFGEPATVVTVQMINIPTVRNGLIDWLNRNVSTENEPDVTK